MWRASKNAWPHWIRLFSVPHPGAGANPVMRRPHGRQTAASPSTTTPAVPRLKPSPRRRRGNFYLTPARYRQPIRAPSFPALIFRDGAGMATLIRDLFFARPLRKIFCRGKRHTTACMRHISSKQTGTSDILCAVAANWAMVAAFLADLTDLRLATI
jgi:hypothetical protein